MLETKMNKQGLCAIYQGLQRALSAAQEREKEAAQPDDLFRDKRNLTPAELGNLGIAVTNARFNLRVHVETCLTCKSERK